MTPLPISTISSSLKTSLIFCQMSSNHSLIAFHLSSIVERTLSQISESLSRIASNISEALFLMAFQVSSAKDFILFQISPQRPFIVLSTVSIHNLIASKATRTKAFIASQQDERNCLIPSQARSQSPVKTPIRKSNRPPRASKTLLITSETLSKKAKKLSIAVLRLLAIIGAMLLINQVMKGCKTVSQTVCIHSVTFPANSPNFSISGCKVLVLNSAKRSAAY